MEKHKHTPRSTASRDDRVLKKSKLRITAPATITINDLFEVKQLLGTGTFGKVYLAVRRGDGRTVALKQVPLKRLPDGVLQREMAALAWLSDPGHPHVCRLHQQLRDSAHSYLVMEYIGGGELFEHLVTHSGPFSERDASKFLRQLAEGLHYIHARGFVHGDLKPENVIMGSSDEREPQLKVIDFGCSVPDSEAIKLDYFGTDVYQAPEYLASKGTPLHPTQAGDMYAVGVIVYMVLNGTHPFDRTNQAPDSVVTSAILQSAADGDGAYLEAAAFGDRTSHLSPSAVLLLKSLLHPRPERRPTSGQLHVHSWMLGTTCHTHCLDAACHCRLRSFWQRRFRAAVVAKFNRGDAPVTTKDLHHIYYSHMHMDPQADGEVTINELKRTCETYGMKEVDDVFLSADENGCGKMDFDSFSRIMMTRFDGGCDCKLETKTQDPVRGCIPNELELEKDGSANLRKLFDTIDLNGDGVLQVSELITVLGETPGMDVDQISAWADKTDTDLNGVIDFEEFCVAMLTKHNGERECHRSHENSCTSTSKDKQCMGQQPPGRS